MQLFAELLNCYSAINQRLSTEEYRALRRCDDKMRKQIAANKVINDNAYFVLFFAQFEDGINEKIKDLIRRMKSAGTWKDRRPWTILNENDIEKIGFMNRVALVFEKGKKQYNKINEYYSARCGIAHGGNFLDTLSIEVLAQDLESFYSALY